MVRHILLLIVLALGYRFGDAAELCPTITASLMNVPGNLDATTLAQRIEIRQCAVNAARKSGAIQLVAWARNSTTPNLTLDLEEAGFRQMSMIEGVYAFELIGGKASQLLVVAFDHGKPRVAAEDSALGKIVITSDSARMLIDVFDEDRAGHRQVRHYEFKAGQGETRRY